jgi:hypothetical protein
MPQEVAAVAATVIREELQLTIQEMVATAVAILMVGLAVQV